MSDRIKIDIVSDVVCPWCIIGYKRLVAAIDELGIQDKVEIEFQPFELNPNMSSEGENVNEHIARKYGSTKEASLRSQESMKKMGDELDFIFDYFEEMRIVNTRDAHVLLAFAKKNRKQVELNMRFVEAFFCERKDISQRDLIISEVENVGLDSGEALMFLNRKNVIEDVMQKEASWTDRGISSVPTMVFDNKSALVGAQSVGTYKKFLLEILGGE